MFASITLVAGIVVVLVLAAVVGTVLFLRKNPDKQAAINAVVSDVTKKP